eukprot:9741891-Lingulodinium_polyedra.AAC.1
MQEEFPPEKLRQGMSKEMQSMDYFQVYQEVNKSQLPFEQFQGVVGTRFLHKWKGHEVKSRLIAQGCNQKADKEDGHLCLHTVTNRIEDYVSYGVVQRTS